MSSFGDNEFTKVFDKYEALVAFVRLQEDFGVIAPEQALELLRADGCYRNYLKLSVGSAEYEIDMSPSQFARAVVALQQRIGTSFPILKEEIARVTHGWEIGQ
jgi:hypothetical protein